MQKNFVKALGGKWLSEVEAKKKGPKKPTHASKDRYQETLAALREQKSLTEIAKLRGLTPQTIVAHIEVLLKKKRITLAVVAYLLPHSDILNEIREALAGVEDDRLAPIFYKLKGRHSYETIRLARLAAM